MALIDHIVVLAHLGPQVISAPPKVLWADLLRKLGVEEKDILALPQDAREQQIGVEGKAEVTASAVSFTRAGLVVEVDWPCGCGQGLHAHHEFVLAAWARHVAEIEGIDADHLERHAVQEIDGRWSPSGNPRVICRCGERFEAEGLLTDTALAAWAAHVATA